LEDLLLDGVRRTGRLHFGCATLSLGPGRQYQTRSLRDLHWLTIQDTPWYGWLDRLSVHRLHLRLEHAANRPGAVAEGASVLQGVPADAGPSELQPRPGPAADQGHENPVGLTAEHGGCPSGRPLTTTRTESRLLFPDG